MAEIKPAVLEAIMGMVVHDLRNPAATLGANLSFAREVLDDDSVPREEVHDALADAQQALHDLTRGLDQLAWFGRWCNERAPASSTIEPLRATLERLAARVRYGALRIEGGSVADVRVRGGEALERLLELLVVNGHQHAPRSTVRLSAREQDGEVVIDVEDDGKPVAPELSELAFTLDGQVMVKGRAEGRYSRVLGLFSASVLAQGLAAPLSAGERGGKNVFTVRLARVA